MTYLRIDLAALGERISGPQCRMTHGDVMGWLFNRGFGLVRGWWIGGASQILQLRQDEIIMSHSSGDIPKSP